MGDVDRELADDQAATRLSLLTNGSSQELERGVHLAPMASLGAELTHIGTGMTVGHAVEFWIKPITFSKERRIFVYCCKINITQILTIWMIFKQTYWCLTHGHGAVQPSCIHIQPFPSSS